MKPSLNKIILFILIHTYSCLLELTKWAILTLSYLGLKTPDWQLKERCKLAFTPSKINIKKAGYWIHGASLGEVKIIGKIITLLTEKYPDTRVITTAFTQSGVTFLKQQHTSQVFATGFLPIDSVFMIKKIIKKFNIQQIWLIETELWPSLLWVCFQRNIKIGIINARLEEQSLRFYRHFKYILKPLMTHFSIILAQNNRYAARFEELGVRPERIKVTGNIKSQITIQPLSPEKKRGIRKKMNLEKENVVITVGCIHPEEVIIIKDTIESLENRGYNWKWIIVPRHIHKASGIHQAFGNNTLLVQDITQISQNWAICIIEAFGVLEDMYAIADAAILGGTFNHVGGHNIWEAAQNAIPVVFGPNYHTQQDSCERLLTAGTGFQVSSANQLTDTLINILIENTKQISQAITTFANQVNQNNNSLKALI